MIEPVQQKTTAKKHKLSPESRAEKYIETGGRINAKIVPGDRPPHSDCLIASAQLHSVSKRA
jgi:hypothetical protein